MLFMHLEYSEHYSATTDAILNLKSVQLHKVKTYGLQV